MTDPQPQPAAPQDFLLGRLFVVPLIIVAVIVVCAVVVVIGFGSISSSKDEPIDKVLARLEASGGERVGGVLLPRDKEMWQAAQELALRLDNLAEEVTPEELPLVQQRVTALLRRELALAAETASDDDGKATRRALFFTMVAAAKAGAVEAVPLLLEAARSQHADVRQRTVAALAAMGDVDAARARVAELLPLLDDVDSQVRVVTAVAMARLASDTDTAVVDALLRACRRLDGDRELRWNAALTLARLGVEDAAVLMVIDELLQRSFWELQQVQYTASDGHQVRRQLTSPEIDQRLVAVLDAVVGLDDDNVWQRVAALGEDPASAVAGRARVLLQEHESGAPVAPQGG